MPDTKTPDGSAVEELEGVVPSKDRLRFLDFKKSRIIREIFFSYIPRFLRKCCKCQRSREDKILRKGRKRLEREINIVEIIKSRRFFKAAIQKLLSEEQRFNLKSRSRYVTVKLKEKKEEKEKKINKIQLFPGLHMN